MPAVLVMVATVTMLCPTRLPAETYDLATDTRVTMMYGGFFDPPPWRPDPAVGDLHGWTVTIGDVDGDGYDDLVSASMDADGPMDYRIASGDAYVVFGGPRGTFAPARDLTADADVTFYGARDSDNFGWSLVCADVDGDGYDDIAFGAPHSDGPDSLRWEAGEAYVFFGRPRAEFAAVYDLRYDEPDVRIIGAGGEARHLTGRGVDGYDSDNDAVSQGLATGDLNGDGYADLAFSSMSARGPQGDRVTAGETYVLFGRRRCEYPAFVDCNRANPAVRPDISIFGADRADRSGFTILMADIDGDGRDELLVTALNGEGENNTHAISGDVYGYWGRTNWASQYDVLLDDFDFAIQGPANYRTGYRISAGDLDGDGVKDLIFGQVRNAEFELVDEVYGRSGCGEYRIVFGGPRSRWARWNEIEEITDTWILGADTGDIGSSSDIFSWGFSMSTGDRDGDGVDDLLITVGGGDGPWWEQRSESGEAYVLRGRPRSEWPAFIDLHEAPWDDIVYGAEGSEQGTGFYRQDAMGWASAMGDLDGNGVDELIMVSMFSDGPDNFRPDCGEVYVVWDTTSTVVSVEAPAHPVPGAIGLESYPNPFTATTVVRLHGREGARARVTVYDAVGRRVMRLVRDEVMHCADEEVAWDGMSESGERLPSGVYFVRMELEGVAKTRKVTLVR
jgi:hypothetical protein